MNQERNDSPKRGGSGPQWAHPHPCARSAPTHVGGYDGMEISRRDFLRTVSMAGAAAGLGEGSAIAQSPPSVPRDRALIAITLDLEMSRNFPSWDDTHWDYEKGNLNEEAKAYSLEAARRVKA